MLLSVSNPPELIVFDEIDVGIGGKVASIVGRMLAELGAAKQVICITHQPQTASYGKHHLVVMKNNLKNITVTSVSYVENDSRVEEIARMLGGINITDTTLNHAREMLYDAYDPKKQGILP
jgi:DNA repair protein RecN (Recombination protein N)